MAAGAGIWLPSTVVVAVANMPSAFNWLLGHPRAELERPILALSLTRNYLLSISEKELVSAATGAAPRRYEHDALSTQVAHNLATAVFHNGAWKIYGETMQSSHSQEIFYVSNSQNKNLKLLI